MCQSRAERRVQSSKYDNPLTEADLDAIPKYTLDGETILDIGRPHDRRKCLINPSGLPGSVLAAPEPVHLESRAADSIHASDQPQQQLPRSNSVSGKSKSNTTKESANQASAADLSESHSVLIDADTSCCAVCLEEYAVGETVRVLPCGHIFHDHCITKWLLRPKTKHHDCPMCKTPCFPEEVISRAHEQARRANNVAEARSSYPAVISVF
ncbi:hypothetical protein GGI12_001757 [Dipsacomyces acuminosporus]|nr:hypothetical protein GGI12_001757 [Dipsacomyces acuminosporus]